MCVCLFICVVLSVRQWLHDPGHAHATCEGVDYSYFVLFGNLLECCASEVTKVLVMCILNAHTGC